MAVSRCQPFVCWSLQSAPPADEEIIETITTKEPDLCVPEGGGRVDYTAVPCCDPPTSSPCNLKYVRAKARDIRSSLARRLALKEFAGRTYVKKETKKVSAQQLTEKDCTWDWHSDDWNGNLTKFAGSCGVAPTITGGEWLPTFCWQ